MDLYMYMHILYIQNIHCIVTCIILIATVFDTYNVCTYVHMYVHMYVCTHKQIYQEK